MSLDIINPYDILFLVVLLIFFGYYFYKGFLYSIVGMLKVVGAAWAGHEVSSRFFFFFYDQFVHKKLVESVASKLLEFRDGLIESFGDDFIGRAISSYLRNSQIGGDLSQAAETVVQDGLQETIVNGFHVLLFCLVFVLVVLVCSLLQNFLVHTNDIPVIGFFNRLLGGFLGVLISIIILFLISMVFSVLLKYNVSYLDQDAILASKLFSVIYKLNPFSS